mmetsp:Transcript_77849/g.137278  ORF Transcript_77849/g.137278 Transcript_77849/m.137278 type:complete len:97 (-) Transcript_77849:147-437(-)|eukprot:CAMPEP_0197619432 /NCGR_PEP_ID=MMETSP1338-20131121/454_1 /TAXON_ID=43686 ORGANISM="Pelagodinium beii, Strain RCC1491" /NCGR_SAMPLE_ID=MMETSP1338 /ASSEMBLY_ACC=CAM_ASM_000754 /LENGTH=96 /DNA_ID=CAMNT_0043188393 /DNA_START=50 /DNA_END=340 /DNA_ORIENTATION=+
MDQIIAMTQAQLRAALKEASAAKIVTLKSERSYHKAEAKRKSEMIKKESRKRCKVLASVSAGLAGDDLARIMQNLDAANAAPAPAPPEAGPPAAAE